MIVHHIRIIKLVSAARMTGIVGVAARNPGHVVLRLHPQPLVGPAEVVVGVTVVVGGVAQVLVLLLLGLKKRF